MGKILVMEIKGSRNTNGIGKSSANGKITIVVN